MILFIIPRTRVIAIMLLAAFLSGDIATHLEHGESIVAPYIIQVILFGDSFFRFPQLRAGLLN